jgi:hypothetical protein
MIGFPRAAGKTGSILLVHSSFQSLILQALCACKISDWNEECTSGMLPSRFCPREVRAETPVLSQAE